MKVFITGESGTGKTTLGRNLKQKGFSVVDIDEDGLCYWIDKKTKVRITYKADLSKKFIDTHSWICDIDRLLKTIEGNTIPVFIIGMPENIEDIIRISDTVILLKCQQEIFINRILKRKDNDFGKDKSAQEIILNRYKSFEKRIENLGAVVINTHTSEEEVVDAVLKTLG